MATMHGDTAAHGLLGDGNKEAPHGLLGGLLHGESVTAVRTMSCVAAARSARGGTAVRRPHMGCAMVNDTWRQHCCQAHRR